VDINLNLGIALVSGGLDSCVTAALATPEARTRRLPYA
jgi:7-cyano-7-deazaguanine synthase in queuosine biosynthesis